MEDIREENTMEDLTAEETEKEDCSAAEDKAETVNDAGEPSSDTGKTEEAEACHQDLQGL